MLILDDPSSHVFGQVEIKIIDHMRVTKIYSHMELKKCLSLKRFTNKKNPNVNRIQTYFELFIEFLFGSLRIP